MHIVLSEMRKKFIESAKNMFDPSKKLEKLSKKALPELFSGKEVTGKDAEELTKLSFAYSLDTGLALLESVSERYRDLAFSLKKDFEDEFKCIFPSEKALVDLLVSSYVKELSYSTRLEANLNLLGKDYDRYREFLSREIDRAHRQFISALETLKAIKQPTLSVNVKSTNAFVAGQQQINATQNEENVKPK